MPIWAFFLFAFLGRPDNHIQYNAVEQQSYTVEQYYLKRM